MSTSGLDPTPRFSVLIMSDQHGATVKEVQRRSGDLIVAPASCPKCSGDLVLEAQATAGASCSPAG